MVIFGASKLPQLGKGLGEGISNFKKGLKDDDATKIENTKEADDSAASS